MYLKNVIEKLRRKKENPQMNTENVTNNFSQTENESTSIKSLKNRLWCAENVVQGGISGFSERISENLAKNNDKIDISIDYFKFSSFQY